MQIPKHIRLELKDSDVEKDIVRILQNMEQLRMEAVLKRAVNADVGEEYKNLAGELAYEIDTMRHNDARLKEKLDVIVSELNKEKLLLEYDPLQDLFWKKKTPHFIKNLDMVLFRFLNVDADTIDKKHHIMQAIKHLLAGDNAILSASIFYGAVDTSAITEEIGFADILKEMGMIRIDSTAVALSSTKESMIENAFKEARKLGYIYLRMSVRKEDYLRNKGLYPGYPVSTSTSLKLLRVKDNAKLYDDHIILENRLQSIDVLPDSGTASRLHELLKEASQKGLQARYPDLISNSVSGGESYKAMMELSQQNREFISDLRKRETSRGCITSSSSISGYKKTESIFLHGNTTYLLVSISESEIEDAGIASMLAARGDGSDKIKKILSNSGVCCARLLRFDDGRLAENYEGVR